MKSTSNSSETKVDKDNWVFAPKERLAKDFWVGKTVFDKQKPRARGTTTGRPPGGGEKFPRRRIVEHCCSDESIIGKQTQYSKNCEVVRVTKEHDVTTSEGRKFTNDNITNSKTPTLLYSSMPCTGGCPWQHITPSQEEQRSRRSTTRVSIRSTRRLSKLQSRRLASDILLHKNGLRNVCFGSASGFRG